MDGQDQRQTRQAFDLAKPVKGSLIKQTASAVSLALVVAFGCVLSLWFLIGRPSLSSKAPTLNMGELFDGLRIALAVVAGLGGVVALVVAYRRQRYTEAQHEISASADSRESAKLFGERFRSSAEQLGSKEPAIRLAGVYAMLNLANDWSVGRQMCVDVLCGYLRMPFEIDPSDEDINPLRLPTASRDPVNKAKLPETTAVSTNVELRTAKRQEFQVRLAVQRTLAAHLRNPAKKHGGREEVLKFWEGIRLDLFGATLCNLDMAGCEVSWCDFRRVTFVGDVKFYGFKVLNEADFEGASFLGVARFSHAQFMKHANFCHVSFAAAVNLNATNFGMDGEFNDAIFGGTANFKGAKFGAGAWFPDAVFHQNVDFRSSGAKDGFSFEDALSKGTTSPAQWPAGFEVKGGRLIEKKPGEPSATSS